MRNHSYENDFDLHEKETACRTHFHMKGFALRLALKQRHKRTRKWPIKINALSICPAAGQVVENTPCPAVKFFVNFQFIMLNPCLYG